MFVAGHVPQRTILDKKTRASIAHGIERPWTIDAQGAAMVAHCVVPAEILRADSADGGVLLAKPNTWSNSARPSSKWKFAYCRRLCSTPSLKLEQHGLLHMLADLSDEYGRVWRGQTTLAKRARCSDRRLRRLFTSLKKAGFLRIERHTFKSLTAAQRALGLPQPRRDDEGRAPALLTLLVEGEAACSFEYPQRLMSKGMSRVVQDKPGQDEPRPSIVRVVPRGQNVQGEPRTKPLETPPDKMSDDPLVSVLDIRKVEGDLTRATPPALVDVEPIRQIVAPPSNSVALPETPNTAPDVEAWRVLNTAYDAHYWRAYDMTPTNKRVSRDEQKALATSLREGTNVLEKRFRERHVDVEKLETKPLEMLANEALGAWFDVTGTNKYLNRRSHPMSALLADLPYRLREAMKVLVKRHAPKPKPEQALAREVSQDKPRTTTPGRTVSPDEPRVEFAAEARKLMQRLFVPTAREVGSSFPSLAVVRPMERAQISAETERILKGLSARSGLREYGGNASLANELLALARECGVGAEDVPGMLDELNVVVLRLGSLTKQAKTNALYVEAWQVFARLGGRLGRGEHDETNGSANVAARATGLGLVENNSFANAAGLGFAFAKRAGAGGDRAGDGGKPGGDSGPSAISWG